MSSPADIPPVHPSIPAVVPSALSPEGRAAIRQRYTPEEPPPCVVCGDKLSIQSMGGGNATVWGCQNFTLPEFRKPDGSPDHEHYRRSRWTQYRPGDRWVLELLDSWEELAEQARRGARGAELDLLDMQVEFYKEKGLWEAYNATRALAHDLGFHLTSCTEGRRDLETPMSFSTKAPS